MFFYKCLKIIEVMSDKTARVTIETIIGLGVLVRVCFLVKAIFRRD